MNLGSKKPRIILADHSDQILFAASQLLRDKFDIVACVNDGDKAVEATLHLRPDVVVLDLLLPGTDGMQVAHQLKRARSEAKIVFLTKLQDPIVIAVALNVGCSGFVFKTSLLNDLPQAIRAALAGRTFVSTKYTEELN